MDQQAFLQLLEQRNSHQSEFLQAATEFSDSVFPYMEAMGAIDADYALLERLVEPDRVISFRVSWEDDAGTIQTNRGYRVQFNAALGPYKGGLRFDPSVNESILKFLAFEQIFKNSLTGLPLGGGKGGADFDPKGKSDEEIRRFCEAFMLELSRHIDHQTDVPAGDIGVGAREIGYLYGAYKRLSNSSTGVLSGKHPAYGGMYGRSEATGYGVVYFAEHMLKQAGHSMTGLSAVVSGAGNVATYCAAKLVDKGVKVLALSDRSGHLHKATGLDHQDIQAIAMGKESGMPLSDIAMQIGADFADGKPWAIKADLYFPCATQNELDAADAQVIVGHKALLVCEGANMPSTLEAIELFRESGTLFGPSKAANAGGVAVSGLEMSQNAGLVPWTFEKVDQTLQEIMAHIHSQCLSYGTDHAGKLDYLHGANIAGFVRVFEAMKHLGY